MPFLIEMLPPGSVPRFLTINLWLVTASEFGSQFLKLRSFESGYSVVLKGMGFDMKESSVKILPPLCSVASDKLLDVLNLSFFLHIK